MRTKPLLAAVPIGLSLLVAGCSHPPTAQDILSQYLEAWQAGNYAAMYSLLSKDAQNGISKADFVKRYKEIYQGIDATGLKIKVPASDSDVKPTSKTDITLKFQTTWKTTITNSFTENYQAHLVKGTDGWKIDWHSNLIFPELKTGWKVHATSSTSTRGQIQTASGDYLVQNVPADQIGLVPGKMGSSSTAKLAQVLGVASSSIKTALSQGWVKPDLFVPIKTMSQQQEKTIESKLLAIPGVLISVAQNPLRVYPEGQVGSHVVGYVGPITAQELTPKKESEGYSATDEIGQQGLESALEPELRGQIGGKIWVSNASGKSTVLINERTATAGDNVKLTINSTIEKDLAKAIGTRVGSAVVLNAKTGAVLGMVSEPGFNPNEFSSGLSTTEWNKINSAKDSPLVNRAVSAVPPGSALKPLVAGVALQDGVIQPSTTFPGTDHLKWQKDSSWGNFYVTRVPHPNGTVDLEHALVWSDNIYFAQVGLALGPDKFITGLNEFGFGQTLSFPLTVEKAQVSDDGKISSQIQLANSAYGQGQVLVSPLQLASMYTVFANNGDELKPYIVQNISTAVTGRVLKSGQRTILKSHVLDAKTLSILNQDLKQVVADPTGTAHDISGLSGWSVEGKTGTAQTTEHGSEWGWFVAWAQKPASKGGTTQDYLIVMALANTQNAGGSHLAVHQVRQFLTSLQ